MTTIPCLADIPLSSCNDSLHAAIGDLRATPPDPPTLELHPRLTCPTNADVIQGYLYAKLVNSGNLA